MKKISIIILLLSNLFAKSQEIINTIDVSDLNAKKIELFNVFNSNDDKKVVHLLKHKRELHASLYDKRLNPIGEKIFLEKFKNYRESISGHSNNGNRFSIYLNDDHEKWAVLSLDFDTYEVLIKDYDIKLRSQDFLNSFSVNDSHYIVTIKKHSSIVFIHKLYPDGSYTSTEYDFSSVDFSGGLRSIGNLHKLMNASSETFQTDLIRNDVPISLRSTNEKVKLYVNENSISMTIDNSRDYTYILHLDKYNSDKKSTIITKDKMKERSSFEDSNSFIYGNHIFSVKSTFEELKFSVTDLSNLKVVKTYSALKNDPINFKSTAILNQKSGNKNTKPINATEDFLEKITNSKPAISVYEQNNKLIVTIGASKQDNSKEEALAVISTLVGGSLGAGAVYSSNANAIDNNFLDYSRTKTTRFQTVLDKNFNQIQDIAIEENVFDKIKNYDLNNDIQGMKALYKLNDTFYYSFIDENTNQIKTVAFLQ